MLSTDTHSLTNSHPNLISTSMETKNPPLTSSPTTTPISSSPSVTVTNGTFNPTTSTVPTTTTTTTTTITTSSPTHPIDPSPQLSNLALSTSSLPSSSNTSSTSTPSITSPISTTTATPSSSSSSSSSSSLSSPTTLLTNPTSSTSSSISSVSTPLKSFTSSPSYLPTKPEDSNEYSEEYEPEHQTQEALDFASEMRQSTLDNKESMDILAQKARDAAPGTAGDKPRTLFGTCWLLNNYELVDNFNIPRQDLYEQYKRYCDSQNVIPVNSATFGKIVRVLWPELKTRRLGTRGQSKYHYCGIRLKGSQYQSQQVHHIQNPFTALMMSGIVNSHTRLNPRIQDGEAGLHSLLPEFPSVLDHYVPLGFTSEDVKQFLLLYRLQCQQFLDFLQTLQFQNLELLLRNFWTHLPDPYRRLVNAPEAIEFIWRCDSILYDTIIRIVLPHPLQQLNIQITQALRHCSRQLESWLLSAMDGYYPMLVARKVEIAKVFGQQLKRHTSLNFLAQGAAQVLESAENMHTMFTEWSKLDFEGIKDQASWVTECRKVDIMQIAEMEMKHLLSSSSKLEQWTTWLDSVIHRFLDEKRDPARYLFQARQFIMKWTFYGSLCMRDLTLRSMSTFGSFHIVRVFLDEYILYVIEQKLAALQSEVVHGETK